MNSRAPKRLAAQAGNTSNAPSVRLPKPRRDEVAGSNAEQAATYLRRLIFSQVLPAGSRVPQDAVATALGMTKIPVREALLALEQDGRVRIEPNRGAFVVAVTEQSARDTTDLLCAMESFAAQRAVERWTPEMTLRLQQANREVQDATDLVQLYHAFEDFQDLLVTSALDDRLAATFSRLRRTSPDTIYEHDPTLAAVVKKTSNGVYRAIKAGDAESVAKILRTGHQTILNRLAPLLRSEGIING
ncbi:GntR family transcriptional regulator [Jatrophihabitans sp. DSM 45814]